MTKKVEASAASRGVLYPARLPTFHREPAGQGLAAFVRWFWIPEWDIEPGRASRQHVVGFPACNLVVENGVAGIAGPTTRASHRDLSGKGWAVGALLLPAAAAVLVADVAALRDAYRRVDYPELAAAVGAAMNDEAPPPERRRAAISAFTDWLYDRLGTPSEEGLLANRMVAAADADSALLSVTDLAEHLHVSVRTVQRLAAKYVGLPPAALIRRRRLQEAAEQLRQNPSLDLAALAHELGYADHAHLTNDFRTTLGFTPSKYRLSLPAGGEPGP
ncbi:helix-turn-helix transcriptional regulator [Rarobacter faecitabidus]|uniref:helix-turn-helix transcriptional regulator n=1 Tax=Rarobacter faecitabidus TaxID=13243 RepID=UPI001FED08AF|nr:helix-turn-helix transcriptional regulator [Rarobacter faecitabidus]